MPVQIDGRGGYDSFALTSRPTGVMLLIRRQPITRLSPMINFTLFAPHLTFTQNLGLSLNEPNMRLLQSDSLSIVLDQDAFQQGYQPPFLLYEYLMHHKMPDNALLYTDIAIRTKYNSDLVVFTDHSK